jgi:hypothetical protein
MLRTRATSISFINHVLSAPLMPVVGLLPVEPLCLRTMQLSPGR